MRTTVGPLPPAVYWRRRLAAVVMIIVLLAGFAACLNQAYGIGDGPGGAGDGRSGTASEGAPNGSDPGSDAGSGPDGTGSDGGDASGADPDAPSGDGSAPGSGSPSATGSPASPGSGDGPADGSGTGDGSADGAGDGSGDGSGPADGGNGTTPGGTPATGPGPTGPPCADADVEVQPGLDRLTYTVGEQPVMTLTVRNVSGRPCVRDVGGDQQELRLTAGKARLWSSDDCQPSQGADRRVVAAGETLLYRFTWSGTTSEPGCRTARAMVGPGTYQLQARLGSKLSAPLTFRIV